MSAIGLMAWIARASPRSKARAAGFFWLMTILTGAFALLAGGRLLRLAANLVATACYLAATVFVYDLLKPVNRNVSLLAASFSLVGCAIGVYSMFASLSARASNIGFVLFGLHCFLVGYLIFRSTFLPRTVGALMAFGGLGWLTLGIATLVSPPLARSLSPYLMAPVILGEAALSLWLLVVGVNVQRWKEQVGAAEQGPSRRAVHA